MRTFFFCGNTMDELRDNAHFVTLDEALAKHAAIVAESIAEGCDCENSVKIFRVTVMEVAGLGETVSRP